MWLYVGVKESRVYEVYARFSGESVRMPRIQGQCELHLIPLASSKLAMRQTPLLATGNTQAQTYTHTYKQKPLQTSTHIQRTQHSQTKLCNGREV